jgi:hypothetical protein
LKGRDKKLVKYFDLFIIVFVELKKKILFFYIDWKKSNVKITLVWRLPPISGSTFSL